MSSHKTPRCDFCQNDSLTSWIGDERGIVCGDCIEKSVFNRASVDVEYRERIIAELVALREIPVEDWDCCSPDDKKDEPIS